MCIMKQLSLGMNLENISVYNMHKSLQSKKTGENRHLNIVTAEPLYH